MVIGHQSIPTFPAFSDIEAFTWILSQLLRAQLPTCIIASLVSPSTYIDELNAQIIILISYIYL